MSNPGVTSSIEGRALTLLGSGVPPEQVAAALGVTTSRISQLLSEESFSQRVTELRFEALSKHNERDCQIDSLEDRLLAKMENLLPLMMRPMEVMKAFQVINGAKRRGQAAPDHIVNQQTVVQITIPAQVVNKYATHTNLHNQVTRAGDQELLTIQSGSLLKQVRKENPLIEAYNDASQVRIVSGDQSNRGGRPEVPARTQQEESRFDPSNGFVAIGS